MTLFRNFRDKDMRGGSDIDDLVSVAEECSGEASNPPLLASLYYRRNEIFQ